MCLSDPIRTGGIHKSHFTGLVLACVREWMSWLVYLSTPGGMYAVAQMCVRMTRRVGICVLLSLQKPVLCVCFHASLCIVWRFREYACASMFTPLLAVALNLCRPIFYRGLLQSKMQIPHEFLIHCMPWLSHRGSQCNLGWVLKLNIVCLSESVFVSSSQGLWFWETC